MHQVVPSVAWAGLFGTMIGFSPVYLVARRQLEIYSVVAAVIDRRDPIPAKDAENREYDHRFPGHRASPDSRMCSNLFRGGACRLLHVRMSLCRTDDCYLCQLILAVLGRCGVSLFTRCLRDADAVGCRDRDDLERWIRSVRLRPSPRSKSALTSTLA
jgi:hypothetical protein